MNLIKLSDTIHRVNAREKDIEEHAGRALTAAGNLVSEMALQGQDLFAIKSNIVHGEWMDLFESNRLRISYKKAQRYMRVATRLKDGQVQSASSLREALALCQGDEEQTQSTEPVQRWPAPTEGISRAGKFVSFIERHPIERWPDVCVERLRTQMRPIAAKLWPDLFV